MSPRPASDETAIRLLAHEGLDAWMRRHAGGIQQGAARPLWQDGVVLQHTSCSQPYVTGSEE